VGFEKFTADSYEEKRKEANSPQLTADSRKKRQRVNPDAEAGAQRTRRNEKRRLEALPTSGQAGATTLQKSTD
jgi:hypothetical protein